MAKHEVFGTETHVGHFEADRVKSGVSVVVSLGGAVVRGVIDARGAAAIGRALVTAAERPAPAPAARPKRPRKGGE